MLRVCVCLSQSSSARWYEEGSSLEIKLKTTGYLRGLVVFIRTLDVCGMHLCNSFFLFGISKHAI